MNLVIDIGNTVAKLALFEGDSLVKVVHTSNQTLEHLPDICLGQSIERVIVATVIDLTQEVRRRLAALSVPLLWLDENTPIPIENLYQTPQTLGYDRLAAAVEANGRFQGRDILVIDMGTCITYEFIDAAGCYYGGNISPGIEMRFCALHTFTGRLPHVQRAGKRALLGRNTESAIREGVLQGVEHEIKGYIRAMKRKYPSLLVFLTGGDDFSFEKNLKSSIFADRYLVLEGLNRILNYNLNCEKIEYR